MTSEIKSGISRREFARRMALASALVPASTLPAVSLPTPPQQRTQNPKLSNESQTEADARYQAILNLYGARFSEAQKNDLRRRCIEAQPALDRLRAYHLENSDDSALYLKPLIEREKKLAVASPNRPATDAAKKP